MDFSGARLGSLMKSFTHLGRTLSYTGCRSMLLALHSLVLDFVIVVDSRDWGPLPVGSGKPCRVHPEENANCHLDSEVVRFDKIHRGETKCKQQGGILVMCQFLDPKLDGEVQR